MCTCKASKNKKKSHPSRVEYQCLDSFEVRGSRSIYRWPDVAGWARVGWPARSRRGSQRPDDGAAPSLPLLLTHLEALNSFLGDIGAVVEIDPLQDAKMSDAVERGVRHQGAVVQFEDLQLLLVVGAQGLQTVVRHKFAVRETLKKDFLFSLKGSETKLARLGQLLARAWIVASVSREQSSKSIRSRL